VKTTKTNLIDIDVFVERRGEDTTKNGGSRVDR
jgi:hypothetical protein